MAQCHPPKAVAAFSHAALEAAQLEASDCTPNLGGVLAQAYISLKPSARHFRFFRLTVVQPLTKFILQFLIGWPLLGAAGPQHSTHQSWRDANHTAADYYYHEHERLMQYLLISFFLVTRHLLCQ